MPVTGPRPRSDAGVRLTTERGTQLLLDERLDELEPLWLSLFDHHQSVHPGPYRARDDSWPHRRRQYEAWLADPEAFAVVARQDGSAVGYALVAMHDGPDDSWPTGHRYAEVETLVVDPQVRGRSVGTALLDAVDSELRALGVDVLAIGVVDGNDEARRLYERRGFRPMVTKLMRFTGQPGGPVA